jgi:hypothetical protein
VQGAQLVLEALLLLAAPAPPNQEVPLMALVLQEQVVVWVVLAPLQMYLEGAATPQAIQVWVTPLLLPLLLGSRLLGQQPELWLQLRQLAAGKLGWRRL